MFIEPKKAFPYKPPSKDIVEKYNYIFKYDFKLPERNIKFFFDKFVSLILLLLTLPIIVVLKIAFIVEGILIPENKGPMFFSYNAVSKGKVFNKYKIRIIKTKFIDPLGAAKGDWLAYSSEWNLQSMTYLGRFVKKFYLDEIPQFYNVLIGDMSIVGPRPLAEIHYKRDLDNGNVSRKLLKGGLLGLGHLMKGTKDFGDPKYEYEYIDEYYKRSNFGILALDLRIIIKGFFLILKGGGH